MEGSRVAKLQIIGGGKMGEALLTGLVATGWAAPTELVVIEPDEGTVRLTHHMAGQWIGSDKVRMVVADASSVTRAKIGRSFGQIDQINYLYADIPPADGDPPLDVLELQQKMCARMVGWRGQEISFVKWCDGQDIERDDVDLTTFDRWCLHIDMVVNERSVDYIDRCYHAAGRQ